MSDDVALSEARNLLVIAPPGCGKTELLARRANHLIASLGANQRILALTFSNKAKANLNERLVKVLGVERKRRYVTVRNFHGHAAEVVLAHGNTLRIDLNFDMPTKQTQARLIDEVVGNIATNAKFDKIRLIGDQLGAAKREPLDEAGVLAALASADPCTLQVEQMRQQQGVWFYEDLVRQAQRLLQVPEIARLYRAHYGAILVDEFQDLSLQQLDIALQTCDKSRTFVGDPLQGIYSWAGARPIEVERVLRQVCGEPRSLGVSYRSSPKVLELLGIVSEELGGQKLQAHESNGWFEDGIVGGLGFKNGYEEAQFIERACSTILQRQPDATIGVICRNGWRRKYVDEQFASSILPCTRWDLAMDNSRIIDLMRESAFRLGGNPSFEDFARDVSSLVDGVDVETAEDLALALAEFEGIVEETGTVAAGLAQLRVLDDLQEVISPGVHILNAHTGKGQQFDWVFIPGLENGNMPDFHAKDNPAALVEEKRVLLVMLSRARHGVVLSHSQTLVSKKGTPYNTSPCPWLPSLRRGVTADANQLIQHIEQLPTHRGD
ncbi:ATP-dependent helicase [Corynebacterium sp. H127]|uniref:ATP-dependent helicase n=1 Tax=Corynebacterium sp. H127 TaxID=3133418 RepID=UPI0030B6E343